MISDESVPHEVAQAVSDTIAETTATARAAATDGAADLETATAAVADQAEAVNQEGAKAASAAFGSTSGAFGAARERLNAMSGTLPGATQEVFRPFQSGGDAFGKGRQASYATAIEGMAEFNSKAIAAWRSNAESTIRHWQSLASVKSLSEAIALSAEHTRHQLEVVTVQTRELSTLATRIVRDAADPLKITGR